MCLKGKGLFLGFFGICNPIRLNGQNDVPRNVFDSCVKSLQYFHMDKISLETSSWSSAFNIDRRLQPVDHTSCVYIHRDGSLGVMQRRAVRELIGLHLFSPSHRDEPRKISKIVIH